MGVREKTLELLSDYANALTLDPLLANLSMDDFLKLREHVLKYERGSQESRSPAAPENGFQYQQKEVQPHKEASPNPLPLNTVNNEDTKKESSVPQKRQEPLADRRAKMSALMASVPG